MPARKPRVPRLQITLSASMRALLAELAELSNQSQSKVAAELLEEVEPVIRAQMEAMKAVASRPEQAAQAIEEYANRAINDIAQASLEFGKKETKRRRKNAAS